VFQHLGASSRISASPSAGASFALAKGNTNPKEITDPPVGPAPPQAPHAAFDGPLVPIFPAGNHSSNGDLDSLFAALASNFDLTHDDAGAAGLGFRVHADGRNQCHG